MSQPLALSLSREKEHLWPGNWPMKRWRISRKICIKRLLQALNCWPNVLTATLRVACRGTGRQGVKDLEKLPVSKHFKLFAILANTKYEAVHESARPGDLVFNRHDEQGLRQATKTCEAYGPGSRFLKGEVEKDVANSENPGRDILSAQTTIKYEALVLFPDCVAPRPPFVRRLDFQPVVPPKNPTPVPTHGECEELLEVRKIDLREVLAHLLEIETRYISKELTDCLNHIASAQRRRGLVKPGGQPVFRESFRAGEQLVEQ
ncbi:hypothetical protein EOA86_16655 [Mesorhizobium sp. M5C.F.Ca.IN.020.32.2.1]|nr:hypothetical protein EOA86_16655 [Mesorhizobium sp. M5C.F.Ca.IN.020.32.2.1]